MFLVRVSLLRRVWAYLSKFERVWACLGLFGLVWACLGLFGLAWACLGLFGLFGAYPRLCFPFVSLVLILSPRLVFIAQRVVFWLQGITLGT